MLSSTLVTRWEGSGLRQVSPWLSPTRRHDSPSPLSLCSLTLSDSPLLLHSLSSSALLLPSALAPLPSPHRHCTATAAKDASQLLYEGTELRNVGRFVDCLATFACIEGQGACTSNVVYELGKNECVHFACHGIPSQERPFESAFALRNGRFTIQHISVIPRIWDLLTCPLAIQPLETNGVRTSLAAATQFAHIDVLANNAGYGPNGVVESTTEEARNQFEVNFWGAVRISSEVRTCIGSAHRCHQ